MDIFHPRHTAFHATTHGLRSQHNMCTLNVQPTQQYYRPGESVIVTWDCPAAVLKHDLMLKLHVQEYVATFLSTILPFQALVALEKVNLCIMHSITLTISIGRMNEY